MKSKNLKSLVRKIIFELSSYYWFVVDFIGINLKINIIKRSQQLTFKEVWSVRNNKNINNSW